MEKYFDVRRKSNLVVVCERVTANSPAQAVGYYVSQVLKRRHEKNKFYAVLSESQAPKQSKAIAKPLVLPGACPVCGYLDPQRDQASHCPNC